jgi:hypothetical protein
MESTPRELFGLMAEFKDPESLLKAAEHVLKYGYKAFDTYTPYPVEGLDEAIGFRKNWVPLITLGGGVAGGVIGFFMQWYADVFDYPINVAGHPDFSWPAFIPVTFELTVLFAGLAAVVGMLALNGLPEPYHPLFESAEFDRASRDRFFICVEKEDPLFEFEATRDFLNSLNPDRIVEVYHGE